MELQQIYRLPEEEQQIQEIYRYFNEDTRLSRSKAARVEFPLPPSATSSRI